MHLLLELAAECHGRHEGVQMPGPELRVSKIGRSKTAGLSDTSRAGNLESGGVFQIDTGVLAGHGAVDITLSLPAFSF